MPEPTSWLTIESGWEVADRSGAVMGEVTAVIGDQDADIFDGLRFETTGGEERFAPGERVAAIVEGRVSLDAQLEELHATPAEEEPGGAEIRPDRPGAA
ncbi:MAG: hypothetical protein ABR581_06645 [Thermoleophilaceae bacterium]